jgi:HK97 family phage major capsid protein
MRKPHEIRAEAAALRAQSRAIETRFNAGSDPMPDAELAQYEDLNRRALALLTEADTVEARERAANDVDALLRRQADNGGTLEREPGDMPHQQRGARYSLLRAIRLRAEGRPLNGLEGEVSDELTKRMGRSPQGFWIPTDLDVNPLRTRADLTLTTGAGAKATITPNTLIELLRNRLVLQAAGARILTGMTGDFSVPAQTAAASGEWVAEGSAPTSTAQTIGTVVFSPKTYSARTLITRKFLLQSSLDAEMFVRDDLARVGAIGVETAVFHGATANPQINIKGLAAISGVTAGASLGTDGGALTWAAVVALESLVTAANADGASMAYISNSKVKGHLKTTPKIGSTYPIYLMDESNQLNGMPFLTTNCVSSALTKASGTGLSAIFCGNWEDYVLALWGAMDILVDPYTSGSSGGVNVYALQDIDGKPRHDASFSKLLDVATS